MRLTRMLLTGAACLITLAGCMKESHLTMTIGEDGKSSIREVWVLDRAQVEEMLQKMRSEVTAVASLPEEEGEAPAPAAAKKGDGEMTEAQGEPALPDADIEKAIRKMVTNRHPLGKRLGEAYKVEKIELNEKTIRVETSSAFESVPEMVRLLAESNMRQTGIAPLVVTIDEADKLKLSFPSPLTGPRAASMVERSKKQVRDRKIHVVLRYVLPGDVLSSTLPNKEGNATWFEMDWQDEASLETYAAILTEGITIVAGKGELALENTPLDSREMNPIRLAGGATAPAGWKLPIEEAVDGYLAEPVAITTTTVYRFKDAPSLPQEGYYGFMAEVSEGCQVKARLYAPAARKILRVGKVTITRAVDDQDREVESDPSPAGRSEMMMSSLREEGEDAAYDMADIAFRLKLPEPDAMALEEVTGEVIVTSFASWKEKQIQPLQAEPGKKHDIGDVVEGATCTITSANVNTARSHVSGAVTVRLEGPAGINDLSIQVMTADGKTGHGNSFPDQRSVGAKGVRIRTVNVNFTLFDYGDGPVGKPVLRLRLPEGLKRERVRFELFGLDL